MNAIETLHSLDRDNITVAQLRDALPKMGFVFDETGRGDLHLTHRGNAVRVTVCETAPNAGRWHVGVNNPNGFGGSLGNGHPADVLHMIRPYIK